MESAELKRRILATIEDLVTDFTYYDRKEDEELSSEQLNNAVKDGIITVDEMILEFRIHLDNVFEPNKNKEF